MYVQSTNVLDTLSGASDTVLKNHVLQVTGAPAIDYRKIETLQILPALNEALRVATVTPTAADATTFTLLIQQVVDGELVTKTVSYDTPATGATATTICDAWRSSINLYTDIAITASGTATLVLTAQTGSPIFLVSSISSGATATTVAYTVSGKSAYTGGTTTATGAVFTKSAHGFVVGDSVTITAATTSVFSVYGTVVSLPFTGVVATVPSSSTFTLKGVTISADGTSVAGSPVAQPAAGTGASLIVQGVSATSGNNYDGYSFIFGDNGQLLGSGVGETHARRHIVYANRAATNYAAYDAQMILNLQAVVSGTTATSEAAAIL